MRTFVTATLAAVLATGTVSARPAPPELLVTPAWLAQHQHDAGLVILEVSRKADYDRGHVPGARLVEPGGLDRDMSSGVMDMSLPDEALLRTRIENLGISNDSRVVVVFRGDGIAVATRVLFLLGFAGQEHATFLDGGVEGWQRAGNGLVKDVPAPAAGHFTAHLHPELVVDFAYVQANLRTPHRRIVDAREPQYYSGPAQMSMAPGHVPGAVNIPFNTVVDRNNVLLAPATLAAMFRANGVAAGDTVVAYCHVGMQATVVVLAARLAGIPVRLYSDSFHDWSAHKGATEGGK